jgi:hypothetical protein
MCIEAVCVSCSRNVNMDAVHVVFKTGFYKAKYPLSVCRECHELQISESIVMPLHVEEMSEWNVHAKVGV